MSTNDDLLFLISSFSISSVSFSLTSHGILKLRWNPIVMEWNGLADGIDVEDDGAIFDGMDVECWDSFSFQFASGNSD